jgi:hypothetical protein
LLFPILSLIIRGVKYSRLQEKLQEEEERTLEAEGFLPSSEESSLEETEEKEEPPSLEKNKNQNGNNESDKSNGNKKDQNKNKKPKKVVTA